MTTAWKAAAVGLAVCGLIGARAYLVRYGGPLAAASPRLEPGATIPHMDHTPRHGGIVLMNGDTHFEVALDKEGNCRVYFTDAVRAELPASIASAVSIGVSAAGAPRQTARMEMDDAARTWVGRIAMSGDPQAIVRVTYTGPEGPYWIDVPLSAWQLAGR